MATTTGDLLLVMNGQLQGKWADMSNPEDASTDVKRFLKSLSGSY
jgi:hypothetical protein